MLYCATCERDVACCDCHKCTFSPASSLTAIIVIQSVRTVKWRKLNKKADQRDSVFFTNHVDFQKVRSFPVISNIATISSRDVCFVSYSIYQFMAIKTKSTVIT